MKIIADRPNFIEPSLPTLAQSPPPGDEWLHEIKYDGYRTQLHVDGGEGRAFTQNGYDWSDRYRVLIDAALKLPCESAVIDGVVVAQAETGACALPHSTSKSEAHPFVFMAFDVMDVDGQDLRRKPLERRRELLQKLVEQNCPLSPVQLSADVPDGHALFSVIDEMGMEGIISKRRDSPYTSGPSSDWIKVECFVEEELVVIGTERGDGPPLALIARENNSELIFVGGAMISLGARDRDLFWQAMVELSEPAPISPAHNRKGASWVRPELRVWVRALRGEEMLQHATVLSIAKLPEKMG